MDNEYDVTICRAATESTVVRVRAATAAEANERAIATVGRYGEYCGTWELDDGNQHEVYLPDPSSTRAVVAR